MKKKVMSVALCGALVLGMTGSALAVETQFDSRNNPASAEGKNLVPFGTTTTAQAESTQDVSITVNSTESDSKVYRVDVEWGSLNFVYNTANSSTWNPDKHAYSPNSSAGWENGGESKIKVTNHSNADIWAVAQLTLKENGSNYSDSVSIDATTNTELTLSNNYLYLTKGLENLFNSAPNGTIGLKATGAPETSFPTVATVKVTVYTEEPDDFPTTNAGEGGDAEVTPDSDPETTPNPGEPDDGTN